MDPYENKTILGAMLRDAAKAAVHNTDGPNEPDLQRLNNILVCEAFVSALADKGCMIRRIPTEAVRKEAAKAAVAASKKTGRPVDPRVAKLAQ